MVAHPLGAHTARGPGSARTATQPDDGGRRYRLMILARTVAEAVTAVGGYACDQALAGWDVTLTTIETPANGDRAARILGLAYIDLNEARRLISEHQWSTQVLAVSTAALLDDDVGTLVQRIDAAEVLLWGARLPPIDSWNVQRLLHVTSVGARAFKRIAQRDPGGACTSGQTEVLLRVRPAR